MAMLAEKKKFNGQSWYVLEAGSMQEFLDFCNKVPVGGSGKRPGGSEWSGTGTWDEANRLAVEGWKDGLDKIHAMSENIGTVVGQFVKKVEAQYEIAGDFVDVGRYCAGEPECMMSFREEVTRGHGSRIVKISINVCVNSNVSKEQMFHRGAAVVALVDALEQSGMVAEVWAMAAHENRGNGMLMIPVKKAGERVELDRMAYIFAHASMLRRHLFTWWDGQELEYRDKLGVGRGYGSTRELPEEVVNEEGGIHLESIHSGNDAHWRSIESATAWVMERLKEQGAIVEGGVAK